CLNTIYFAFATGTNHTDQSKHLYKLEATVGIRHLAGAILLFPLVPLVLHHLRVNNDGYYNGEQSNFERASSRLEVLKVIYAHRLESR
uniref:Uncharacterized protein n=1 Tax=Anopheles atroparvus TaxID=41427 RepID=A0AAG5DJV2_ANOAO